MLTGRQSLPVIAAQGMIALVVLLAATFLAYADKLDGEAVTALFGMAIALAGQTAGSVANAVSAQPAPVPTKVTTPQGVTVLTNGAIAAEAREEGEGGASH